MLDAKLPRNLRRVRNHRWRHTQAHIARSIKLQGFPSSNILFVDRVHDKVARPKRQGVECTRRFVDRKTSCRRIYYVVADRMSQSPSPPQGGSLGRGKCPSVLRLDPPTRGGDAYARSQGEVLCIDDSDSPRRSVIDRLRHRKGMDVLGPRNNEDHLSSRWS